MMWGILKAEVHCMYNFSRSKEKLEIKLKEGKWTTEKSLITDEQYFSLVILMVTWEVF